MPLDLFQRHFYRLQFQVRYLRAQGNEFQEFFRSIMEHAYPNDFIAVRTHGNVGDKKCDGYRQNGGIIYQCYAPRQDSNLAALLKKMQEDFDGAKDHWKAEMKQWVFVHNDDGGLPADAVKLLEKFKTDNKGLETGQHGIQELGNIVDDLPEAKLSSLFGPLPSRNMVANIGNADIQAAVQGIQHYDPRADMGDPIAPSAAKLDANGLSVAVIELIRGGFVGAKRVQGFFDNYPVPDYVDTVASAFKREYIKLREDDIEPDEIYDSLYHYASGDGGDANRRAAVLAVLSYFFERCDIFEDSVAQQ